MDIVNNKKILISFDKDEALIFFEWLSKLSDDEKNHNKIFSDSIEEKIVYELESILEEAIPEIFESDYKKKVLLAKKRIESN